MGFTHNCVPIDNNQHDKFIYNLIFYYFIHNIHVICASKSSCTVVVSRVLYTIFLLSLCSHLKNIITIKKHNQIMKRNHLPPP